MLSGYALALAVFLLTAGSLADRFGRRRLFIVGLTLFSLASGLCALAPGAGALIAARLVQGLGAAVVFPSSLAILAEAYQGPDRRRAIGAWGATIGLAFAAGPLIGGVLVDTVGWRGVFAASFVLGAPTLMLALRHIAESRDPDPPPVDWAGVGTLSLGLFAGVFAVLRGNALGWTSTTVLGCLALCVAALGAFVAIERATPRPMLDLALFRNRTFAGATAIVALLAGGPFGAFVYVVLFLLDVQERDPVEAGLVLAPLALVSFVVSAVAGRASERVPLRGALVAGMLVTAVGVLALRAGISEDATWLALLPGLAITGARRRAGEPADDVRAPRRAAAAQGGLASALNNTARQIGLAIGIAVLGALLEAGLREGHPFAEEVGELLLISAGLSLLAALAAAVLVRQRDLWVPAPPPR